MTDVLTRFREHQKPSPTPVMGRFRERERELVQPADSLLQRFRAREQEVSKPVEEPLMRELLSKAKDFEYGKPRPEMGVFFEQLAQWQAGEYIDPHEKEAIAKQWKKVGRFALSSPLIVPQFFHALITDPRAAASGMANMFKDAFNNFAIIQSPLSTDEQVRKADEYFTNDPVGLAFSALILGGIGARVAKAPKVKGIEPRKPLAKVEKIERALGKKKIEKAPIEILEAKPVKLPIKQQLPDYLKPAFDSLPPRVVNESPVRGIVKRGEYPLYDHRTKQLTIPSRKIESGTIREFRSEMIASWAWEHLSPKQYNEWRKSIGRPKSFDVQGGVGGGMSNVDSFAESTISWMEGRPWGKSGEFFEKLFDKGAKPIGRLEKVARMPREPGRLEEAAKWATRTKDLQRIHIKQRRIPVEDANFVEMKKRVAGKESLKDFTWGEMVRYEAVLDQMIARESIRIEPAPPAKLAKPAKTTKVAPPMPWPKEPKVHKSFKALEEMTREAGEDLINKAPSETLRIIEEITDAAAFEIPMDVVKPTALEIVKGLPPKLIPAFIKQTRKRVKSEPAQEMLARIRKGDGMRHTLAGDMLEEFNKAGLKVIEKRGWGPRLGQALTEGKAKSFRKLFDRMYDEARAVGVKVAKYNINYFPRMVKHEVARILQGDITTMERRGYIGNKAFEISKDVGPILREAMQRGQIKPETRRVLEHLVESGQAETYIDAVAKLKNFTHSEMFSPFGNLEKTRVLKLPLDFYEMDATKVIPRYVRGWAKRVAEVDQFGPKSEVYHDLRLKIDAISTKERQIIDHAVAAWTGAIVRDPKYSMTKRWRKVVDAVVQFEVITKIGLGTATIPNITQSFISTIPHFGVFRTSRGFYRALRRGQVREMFRRSGAPLDISARQWSGFETTGKMGRVADRILSIAFTPVNKMNALISASTVESSLAGYYKLANLKPLETPLKIGRSAHAKRVLEFLNVDWKKPLTEKITLEAMYRAATDLQVMRNILRDPLSAHNPRLKSAWLFKRFGLKQAQLIKDIVFREVRYGNVWPLLRLGAGGYLGGEFVLWSVNMIKSKVSEKEYYTEDKKGWERIMSAFSAVGSVGVIGDLLNSGLYGDYPAMGTIEFTIIPVQVQTLNKIADTVVRFATEAAGDYGLLGATERLRGTVPRLLGPVGTQVGKRLQTDAQRASRLRFERGQIKSKILDLLLDGKADQAARVWTAWTKHNPHNLAFGQYDEYGRFLGRKHNIETLLVNREMERAKKKARP